MDNSSKRAVENVLAAVGEMSADVKHFGVKGMKWGVRKDAQGKEVAKADLKWDKKLNTAGTKAIIATVKKAAPEVERINSKPEYSGKDLSKPGPLKDKYLAEHAKAFETMLNNELPNHISANSPSGTYTAKFIVGPKFDGPPILDVTYTSDSLSQSGIKSDGSAQIDVVVDSRGMIVSYEFKPDFIEQGSTFTDKYLEHFGVKGMRWGVRRSRKELARASGEKESNDTRAQATKSKEETKTSSKKARVKDLSDAELRAKLNRMQMEQQYAQLTAPKGNPLTAAGKKVAANVVKGVAEQTLKNIGQSYSTKYTAQYMANYKTPIPAPPMLNPLRGAPKTPRMG